MDHWIEPQALGDAQRAGYDSPLAEIPVNGVQHYVNRPGQLQGLGQPVQHYVNRPGQLRGLGTIGAIKDMKFGWGSLLLAGAAGVLLSTQIKGVLGKLKKKVKA